MFCEKFKMLVCVSALAMLVALVGNARAEIVATHGGPTEFDGTGGVSLSQVTIGLEGRVDLEFKADITSGYGCIWYLADVMGGDAGEHRGGIYGNDAMFNMWNSTDGTLMEIRTPFSDTDNWHSLSFAWKDGEKAQLTLDGTLHESSNTVSLNEFTSGSGLCHSIGGFSSSHGYDGWIKNVVVRNTYEIPEPSTLALLATGLIGLLCYAWRKRR